MEAGVVEEEHDTLFGAGADRLGEPVEQAGEDQLGHAVGQVPHRLARGRSRERRDVEPLEAVVAKRGRALPLGGPHRAQNRLQPKAVLVGAEHLDRVAGVVSRFLGDGTRELFLNASASPAVAGRGFLGRGRCNDQPSAFKASQPRRGSTRSRPRWPR